MLIFDYLHISVNSQYLLREFMFFKLIQTQRKSGCQWVHSQFQYHFIMIQHAVHIALSVLMDQRYVAGFYHASTFTMAVALLDCD